MKTQKLQMPYKGRMIGKAYDKFGNIKMQFQPNKLWYFIKRRLKLDIQIPFLTGYKTTELRINNNITAIGFASMLAASGSVIISAGMGTGTPATNALGNQVVRGATSMSQTTTDNLNDTLSYQATFMFSGNYTLTEEGLFDSLTTGNMIAFDIFPGVPMFADDVYILHRDIQGVNV